MMEYCDVCILCALDEEARAFKQVLEEHGITIVKKYSPQLKRDYFDSTIQNNAKETLRVIITWLPNMGSLDTISDFSNLLQHFQIRFAAMTGICAGNKEKVSLGDIIVADKTFFSDGGSMVTNQDGNTEQRFDTKTIQVWNDILQFAKGFEDWQKEGLQLPRPSSKHQQRDWLLNTLLEKKTIQAINKEELATNVPMWRVLINEFKEGKEPFLSPSLKLINEQKVDELRYGLEEFPYIDPPAPKCYIGPMASSNAVHKDSPFPIISLPVRKLLALDMESMAFYYTLQERNNIRSLAVKGVCDYADGDKDDSYHNYAAKLSAIYVYSFIQHFVTEERMPSPERKISQSPIVQSNLVQQAAIPTTQTRQEENIMGSNEAEKPRGETGKRPVKLFFSYSESEKDEKLLKELYKHFAIQKRNKLIEIWDRRDLRAGDTEETLKKKLDEAQIVILLITPDYVSSAIYEQEYDLILKHSEKGAIVIPILLRAVSADDWKEEFYGKFQVLPRNRKAVDLYNDQDLILAEIATEIKLVVKSLSEKA